MVQVDVITKIALSVCSLIACLLYILYVWLSQNLEHYGTLFHPMRYHDFPYETCHVMFKTGCESPGFGRTHIIVLLLSDDIPFFCPLNILLDPPFPISVNKKSPIQSPF